MRHLYRCGAMRWSILRSKWAVFGLVFHGNHPKSSKPQEGLTLWTPPPTTRCLEVPLGGGGGGGPKEEQFGERGLGVRRQLNEDG